MVSATSIDYHAVQRTGLFDNLVNCCGDGGFLCHVCVNGAELPGVALFQGGEVLSRLADVDRVDFGGTVGETAFRNTKANSTIGAGYWIEIRDVSLTCSMGYLLAMILPPRLTWV